MERYFTFASEEEQEEIRAETLGDLYKEYLRYKADDKENHFPHTYYFKLHEIVYDEKQKRFIDYQTEGKVYKRKNKIFFKPL